MLTFGDSIPVAPMVLGVDYTVGIGPSGVPELRTKTDFGHQVIRNFIAGLNTMIRRYALSFRPLYDNINIAAPGLDVLNALLSGKSSAASERFQFDLQQRYPGVKVVNWFASGPFKTLEDVGREALLWIERFHAVDGAAPSVPVRSPAPPPVPTPKPSVVVPFNPATLLPTGIKISTVAVKPLPSAPASVTEKPIATSASSPPPPPVIAPPLSASGVPIQAKKSIAVPVALAAAAAWLLLGG